MRITIINLVFNSFQKLFFVLLILLTNIFTITSQTVNNGILDLRNSNALNEKVIDLSGEWQFYFGKHLSTVEINNNKLIEKNYVKIPSSWDYYNFNGKSTPSFGIGT